jgi:hypothetical protein
MPSPLVTLLFLVLGLTAGVLLVGSLVQQRPVSSRWVVAAAIVGVVVLAAHWPGKLRVSGQVLDAQRAGTAAINEPAARERCLHDMGRADLVDALAFARMQMPDDARFYMETDSPSLACLTINLLPREPVRRQDFDPARDWTILDGAAAREASTSPRHLVHSPSFILVRPNAEAAS